MKEFYQKWYLVLVMALSFSSFGQNGVQVLQKPDQNVPVLAFPRPDLTQIQLENLERDRNGFLYRFGFANEVHVTTQNNGVWSTLPNGDKVWRLKVKYPGAQALSFYFSKFYLFGRSEINVYNAEGEKLHQTYTAKDVQETGVQNMSLCIGDNMMIELIEPAGTPASILEMESIAYAYRSITRSQNKNFGDSENCQVNVNCSEGNSWQDEKKGVARILVYSGQSQGWCSGSLVNNTNQDCKPYFLSAMHCADGSSTNNFAQWRFYFKYESSGCSSPNSQGTLANNYITGCLKIAGSNDVNGNTIAKSDFLLVKLGTASNEQTIISTLKNTMQAYWNGWDANNVTSNAGVSIHHPAGDIKKISTYSANLASTSYSGVNANTHWRVTWVSTANGHGVTEGGSSGSPIFDAAGNSRIKGVLSGGSSYCSATNSPDLYGKLSYSWTSAGTTNATQLKPWLDPTNSGVMVLDGSSNPCSGGSTPVAPVAQFVANQTNITPNTTVTFSDQSSNSPTSWSWSVSPTTGFTYAGGTSSSSQNPQITFTAVGSYTITLVASNSAGSDSEVKNAYIIVANPTGPCTATSNMCDEYIGNVQLNTINNSTVCNNYTDYSSISTTLVKGQSYTLNIAPAVNGTLYSAYTNDQIAAYIDFNNDMDFEDAGERIAYSVYNGNYTGTFNFTVPANAATGTVRMRVRIHYPTSAMPNVLPCGNSTNGGEVEDYRINIVASGSNVGLEDVSMDAITLYPNPVNEAFTVALNSNYQTANVLVMDLAGKEILKSNHSNVEQITLNVADLSSGMYHVVISTELGQIIRKINKQ